MSKAILLYAGGRCAGSHPVFVFCSFQDYSNASTQDLDLTVGHFYREVAKLGGFLGRKSDGEPGWITIWRGWEKLNTYVFVASKLKLQV